MTKAIKSVNELYNEIFMNSPRRLEMTVPNNLGTGTAYRTVTKKGIILSTLYMKFFDDIDFTQTNSDGFVYIWFCFGEGITWSMNGQICSLKKGQSCIYIGSSEEEISHYERDKEYYLRCIKMPASYFWYLINRYFEWNEVSVYATLVGKDPIYVDITFQMEDIFRQLREYKQYQSGLGFMYLESKIHELIALYLVDVFKVNINSFGRGVENAETFDVMM